jgi:hypothetical protein
MAARNRLAAAGDDTRRVVKRLDEFLAFELGGDDEQGFDAKQATAMLGAARGDASNSMNKRSMKLFKDIADDVRYLLPHKEIMVLPGAGNVRVYVLGPPKDLELLMTLDPEGSEEFQNLPLSRASTGNYFAAAFRDDLRRDSKSPFASRFGITIKKATRDREYSVFFRQHYGAEDVAASRTVSGGEDEADDNPNWRRIDKEWHYSAELLAIDMNNETNNSSLGHIEQ